MEECPRIDSYELLKNETNEKLNQVDKDSRKKPRKKTLKQLFIKTISK